MHCSPAFMSQVLESSENVAKSLEQMAPRSAQERGTSCLHQMPETHVPAGAYCTSCRQTPPMSTLLRSDHACVQKQLQTRSSFHQMRNSMMASKLSSRR